MDFASNKLGDLSSVTTGLVVKRKQAEIPEEIYKTYKMLTLKSFAQDGWLNLKELEIFESNEKLEEKYLTQEGDVVVRLSYPNTAVVIDKAKTGIVIPSLFVVIRLQDTKLHPAYLSIYLNSDLIKCLYAKQAIGSTIQIIKTSMLKDMLVKFPKLMEQEKVIKVHELILKEKQLLNKLREEKNLYQRELINKCLRGGF